MAAIFSSARRFSRLVVNSAFAFAIAASGGEFGGAAKATEGPPKMEAEEFPTEWAEGKAGGEVDHPDKLPNVNFDGRVWTETHPVGAEAGNAGGAGAGREKPAAEAESGGSAAGSGAGSDAVGGNGTASSGPATYKFPAKTLPTTGIVRVRVNGREYLIVFEDGKVVHAAKTVGLTKAAISQPKYRWRRDRVRDWLKIHLTPGGNGTVTLPPKDFLWIWWGLLGFLIFVTGVLAACWRTL